MDSFAGLVLVGTVTGGGLKFCQFFGVFFFPFIQAGALLVFFLRRLCIAYAAQALAILIFELF